MKNYYLVTAKDAPDAVLVYIHGEQKSFEAHWRDAGSEVIKASKKVIIYTDTKGRYGYGIEAPKGASNVADATDPVAQVADGKGGWGAPLPNDRDGGIAKKRH